MLNFFSFFFFFLEVELRDQGFNPSAISDPLYIFNANTKSYEPFGPAQYDQIANGKSRL